MTAARTSAPQLVRELFAAVDNQDANAVGSYVTDDLHFRFGSADPVIGKDEFVASSEQFLASLAGIRHQIISLWEVEEGTVVAIMDVHYRRHDGREHTLPCSNLFRLRDGKVHDYRIYMDIAPIFAD
ncbi:nuclear transport factor 2 family protein [Pseudonocardia xishanensis]|uniref:SnoaL-like domain-containing protein n=1 Tax=Pseudonocardia xishanensis TaxID=630995 RepID=A0ABP8RF92_9PSEU